MIYCYHCLNCGYQESRSMPASEYQARFNCPECGRVMERDHVSEGIGFRNTPGNWPMESDAAGVHPDQAKELSDYAASKGVPTEVNAETGNPIFHSREHRKKFCQATNMYDRNAGIGDATPENNMKRINRKANRDARKALQKKLARQSRRESQRAG